MKLSQLVGADLFMPPEWDREFNHVVTDSRDVQKGDVFIARQGTQEHGQAHIKAAIEQGAIAVLAAGEMEFRCEASPVYPMVPVFTAPEVTKHLPLWLHRRYNIEDLQLIAVTGTNGKSSVTQYIAQLALLNEQACGVFGTLGNGQWPKLKPTRNTTPDLSVILRHLDALKANSVNLAALEVSSHGIDQKRVQGLHFDVAILTNVTQDHLDYHGTMEQYFTVKRRLFAEYNPRVAIINIDDEYGQRLAKDDGVGARVITYGRHPQADVRYELTQLNASGMHANIVTPWGNAELVLPLIGEFNLANTCAAIAALVEQGLDFNQLCLQAANLKPVAGRMELYVKDNAPLAVVDFAHTPDALINVLSALKPWQRELTTVFGCGGDRDRSKRPKMLNVVLGLSDHIWLTDDNPRGEDPQQIFNDVLSGNQNVNQEHDRTLAITNAIKQAAVDGIVLIAGKGHENYQEIMGVKHAYSDANVLASLGYVRAGGNS